MVPSARILVAHGTEVMLPVLVMVASFSKVITALMTRPAQAFGDVVVARPS